MLAATNKKAMKIQTEEEDWVLDLGCTYHMTSKKKWFVDYKLQDEDSVYVGNNQDCEIIGVGSVLLKSCHIFIINKHFYSFSLYVYILNISIFNFQFFLLY